jgi:hypothetical protein
MYAGPNANIDGLVFGYDAGINRFNNGMPGVNITTGFNLRWSGANNAGSTFESNGYEEYVDIPTLGRRLVRSMDIYNDYPNSGNCCPSLFEYGYSLSVSGNTTYAYQIIYKVNSGYTHPNFMYHYEYNGGSYITEYGVHTTGQREHIGDGWYHAWATFTTNASCNIIHTGLWYYQYNVRDKVSLAAISIVQGSNIRPYQQLIPSATTRKNDESLIDVKRSTTIDVSNVSFNGSGQPTFDGTNDTIELGTQLNSYSTPTIEAIFKSTDTGNTSFRNIVGWGATASGNYSGLHIGNITSAYGDESLHVICNGATLQMYVRKGHSFYHDNQYHHVVATLSLGANKIYIDGEAQDVYYLNGDINTNSGGFNLTNNLSYIGRRSYGTDGIFLGEIPVVKIYNRPLSATEVYNNYLAYKGRFGI